LDHFEKHDFGDIPHKYIMRSGQLAFGTQIKGITKTLEKWKNIYKNADEYIYEILSEIPSDLFAPLTKRVKAGIKSRYIVSEFASVPQGRKAELKKSGFNKLIENGLIERKMRKYVKVIIVLNEKEACVCFPDLNGEADLTEMFYGNDYQFHEWCIDYFRDCWSDADLFIESKLKE
jgi:predicted transcriptional regulator